MGARASFRSHPLAPLRPDFGSPMLAQTSQVGTVICKSRAKKMCRPRPSMAAGCVTGRNNGINMTGYSEKPLYQILGIKDHSVVLIKSISEFEIVNYLDEYPGVINRIKDYQNDIDFIHLFVDSFNKLSKEINNIIRNIKKDGIIWISWSKKGSKLNTDITDNKIRNLVIPLGLVDTKVCSVSDKIWTGLKIVWRKENR